MPKATNRPRTRTFSCEGRKMDLENLKKGKCLSPRRLVRIYKSHKKYCRDLEKENETLPNLPPCISESLVCMHERGSYRIKSCKNNKKGDIYSRFLKVLIEVKATKGRGPSSFGTESLSELFYYIHVDIKKDMYEIFKFNRVEIKEIIVSKDCTIGKVWLGNKRRSKKVRPRANLLDWAKKTGKKPSFKGRIDEESLKSLRNKPQAEVAEGVA